MMDINPLTYEYAHTKNVKQFEKTKTTFVSSIAKGIVHIAKYAKLNEYFDFKFKMYAERFRGKTFCFK